MTIELHSSQPPPELLKCVRRVGIGARLLAGLCGAKLVGLSAAEARAVYGELEMARDALSLILDRADGKSD